MLSKMQQHTIDPRNSPRICDFKAPIRHTLRTLLETISLSLHARQPQILRLDFGKCCVWERARGRAGKYFTFAHRPPLIHYCQSDFLCKAFRNLPLTPPASQNQVLGASSNPYFCFIQIFTSNDCFCFQKGSSRRFWAPDLQQYLRVHPLPNLEIPKPPVLQKPIRTGHWQPEE
jgi:hypothetical protein